MRIAAMIPTWNEAENIGPLLDAVLGLGAEYGAIVVDDNSPDGTWRIVQQRASSDPRVTLIHRTTERGRGTAGIAGLKAARDAGFDAAVEMDADFSHNPALIPMLTDPVRSGDADIVIGSRLVPGGGEVGRPPLRRLITQAANGYIRILLRLPVRDCTSGFRVFSSRALQSIPWEQLTATGPEVVQEILWHARRAGLRMAERPILFEERRAGQSTFNARIMRRSLLFVARLALRR